MGIKLHKLNLRQMVALIYTLMIDDLLSSDVPRYKARQAVDDWLNETGENMQQYHINADAERSERQAEADRREIEEMRKTWGKLPEHIAGQRAAMGIQRQTIPPGEQ